MIKLKLPKLAQRETKIKNSLQRKNQMTLRNTLILLSLDKVEINQHGKILTQNISVINQSYHLTPNP